MTSINVLSTRPVDELCKNDKAMCGLLLYVLHENRKKPLSFVDLIPPLNGFEKCGGEHRIFSGMPIREKDVCGVLALLAQEGLATMVEDENRAECAYVPTPNLQPFLCRAFSSDAALETLAVSLLVSL